MKKRVYMAVLALLLLCVSLPIQTLAAVPKQPMEALYVNDYADVLSKADEAEIVALGTALEDATGAQVVAVTVTFFDGMEAEEYSYQLFNNWKLGQKDENNGVLFVLSVGDREAYTAVGMGLEDSLPASVTGKMLDDYGIPHFAQDDFSLGTRAMYTALCNKVASIYNVTLPQSSTQDNSGYAPAGEGTENAYYYDYGNGGYGYNSDNEGGNLMNSIIMLVTLVVILAIVRSVFRASRFGSGMPGCLFGWILGRGTRPRSPWGGWGWWGSMHRHPRPPRPPMHGHGGPGFGPAPPRPKPPGGRSTGGFGGFGGGGPRSGGGGRSGGGPRVGGGGMSRGGGSGRKF